MARSIPTLFFVVTLFSFTFSSCFKAIGDSLGAGFLSELNEEELQEILDKSSRTVIQSSMDEFLKDSIQREFRAGLGVILAQTGDSLNQISLQVVENFMGKYTEDWLNARSKQLTDQMVGAIQKAKGELMNEDIENYLRNLSKNVIRRELNGLVSDLLTNLTSEESLAKLRITRSALTLELDTLIRDAVLSAVSNYDQQLKPRVDSLDSQTRQVLDEGKDTSNSIIRRLIWGVGGLILFILLAFLTYSVIWQRRYKSMVSIITKNIDAINPQETYDQLTKAIRAEMSQKGLEKHLRTVLEEQELIEQKEWENKDQQLLKLLSEELAKNEDGTKSIGPQTMESIKERARSLGLEDHLNSVFNRMKQK